MNLIPIRDRLGTIIGLQPKEQVDAVQATIDASMQTLGASPQPPAQPQAHTRPALRFELGVVLLVILVVGVWLSMGTKPLPPRIPLPPTSIATRTPNPSPVLTASVTPTNAPTEEPTSEPTVRPTEETFSPPPPPPEQLFCADRASQWGNTHQCASTQAAADAIADGEIGRINATAEAIQKKQ